MGATGEKVAAQFALWCSPMQTDEYLTVDLASERATFDAALAELASARAVERLWAHDPSLWKPRPQDDVELSNRLGWLTLPDDFLVRVSELAGLAAELTGQG